MLLWDPAFRLPKNALFRPGEMSRANFQILAPRSRNVQRPTRPRNETAGGRLEIMEFGKEKE